MSTAPLRDPCPFCGSTDLWVSGSDRDLDRAVRCDNCGAAGPSRILEYGGTTRKQAVRWWAVRGGKRNGKGCLPIFVNDEGYEEGDA